MIDDAQLAKDMKATFRNMYDQGFAVGERLTKRATDRALDRAFAKGAGIGAALVAFLWLSLSLMP